MGPPTHATLEPEGARPTGMPVDTIAEALRDEYGAALNKDYAERKKKREAAEKHREAEEKHRADAAKEAPIKLPSQAQILAQARKELAAAADSIPPAVERRRRVDRVDTPLPGIKRSLSANGLRTSARSGMQTQSKQAAVRRSLSESRAGANDLLGVIDGAARIPALGEQHSSDTEEDQLVRPSRSFSSGSGRRRIENQRQKSTLSPEPLSQFMRRRGLSRSNSSCSRSPSRTCSPVGTTSPTSDNPSPDFSHESAGCDQAPIPQRNLFSNCGKLAAHHDREGGRDGSASPVEPLPVRRGFIWSSARKFEDDDATGPQLSVSRDSGMGAATGTPTEYINYGDEHDAKG